MPLTRVKGLSSGASAATSHACSWDGAGNTSITAGNLVKIQFSIFSDTDLVTGVTDDFGNTYARAGISPPLGSGAGERVYEYYKDNCLGGASGHITVALSVAAGIRYTAEEYSGTDGLALGSVLSANGTGSVPSGVLTTLRANSVISAMAVSSGDIAGNGTYTVNDDGASNFYETQQYLLDAGAAGAKTVDFGGSTGTWTMLAVEYRVPAAGGGGLINRFRKSSLGAGLSRLLGGLRG